MVRTIKNKVFRAKRHMENDSTPLENGFPLPENDSTPVENGFPVMEIGSAPVENDSTLMENDF